MTLKWHNKLTFFYKSNEYQERWDGGVSALIDVMDNVSLSAEDYSSSSRRMCITSMALFMTLVPGPKMAATPALYR